MFHSVPDWLDPTYNFGIMSAKTTGSNGQAIRTAFEDIDVGDEEEGDGSAIETMMQRYCRQMYVQESLKHRYGEVAGKLRFDIAPGSSAAIDCIGEQLAGSGDLPTERIYGKVVRVTYLIDAQNQRAGTAFAFTHLRTSEENENDQLTVTVPPLYNQAWAGAPLVV